MKKIALKNNNGEIRDYALVDDEDFEWLNQYTWHLSETGRGNTYVETIIWRDKKYIHIRMHRFIMKSRNRHEEVDHRDGNGLNNQKSNLRTATSQQNRMNGRVRKDNLSGYKGVSSINTRKNLYTAKIQLNKKIIILGYFLTPTAAARAYDAKAKELFGEFAKLNFPEPEKLTNAELREAFGKYHSSIKTDTV